MPVNFIQPMTVDIQSNCTWFPQIACTHMQHAAYMYESCRVHTSTINRATKQMSMSYKTYITIIAIS